MVKTVSIEEAQANLKELVGGLSKGDEIVITQDSQPVARLVGETRSRPSLPEPGLGRGEIIYISPDFDAPLEEFKEYME